MSKRVAKEDVKPKAKRDELMNAAKNAQPAEIKPF